jgi:hypothetical protein
MDAWFWQVQCQIIRYLLHRYAGGEIQNVQNLSHPQF